MMVCSGVRTTNVCMLNFSVRSSVQKFGTSHSRWRSKSAKSNRGNRCRGLISQIISSTRVTSMLPILTGFMVAAKKWKVAGAEPRADCGALPRWPNLFFAQEKWAGGAAVPPSPSFPGFNLPDKSRNLFSGRRCWQRRSFPPPARDGRLWNHERQTGRATLLPGGATPFKSSGSD